MRRIEPNAEKMWAALAHKVRTDIRKGIKSDLTADFGGERNPWTLLRKESDFRAPVSVCPT